MIVAASTVKASSTLVDTVEKGYDGILKQYLIKALESTGNLIDKSVDMVMQQAPILVQEVLHWYFAYNLILFILGLIMLGVLAFLNFKFYKMELRFMKSGHDDGFLWLPVFVVDVAAFLTIVFNCINLTWLKILIAPRLWLIEYATQLVKAH